MRGFFVSLRSKPPKSNASKRRVSCSWCSGLGA